jgi:hypothetical protein
MEEIFDVNFQDEPLFDPCVIRPEGVRDTNGETWVCIDGQPYPVPNDEGYISLCDQHMMQRDNPVGEFNPSAEDEAFLISMGVK